MASTVSTRLRHPRWGDCDLVRIEATDWMVRVESTGVLLRVPPEQRGEYEIVEDPPSSQPAPQPPQSQEKPVSTITFPRDARARQARRVIESLRAGQPALDGNTQRLAVGFDRIHKYIQDFLKEIDEDGGAAMMVRGAYGQGKTFALTMMEEVATETGFVTVRTEIDATENRLNKPHHVYRDMVQHLRLPNGQGTGIRRLAEEAHGFLKQNAPSEPLARRKWLAAQLRCEPLAWLFSDPDLIHKPLLLGLLECDPNVPVMDARKEHCIPGQSKDWPAFSASTQGDFASYLLSGLGRLSRLMGHKGLLIVMDEMEKWNQMNWAEQCQAGNLLGGLIWGATAEGKRRHRRSTPKMLRHSGRCGGYPFTTIPRCYTGIAIAMTPTPDHDPVNSWAADYGPIQVLELPAFTERRLAEYCRSVVPVFCEAYGTEPPTVDELEEIAAEAVRTWRTSGDMSTRTGVQSVIAAFDNWRGWRELQCS